MHHRETKFDRFRHHHPLTFYDQNHANGNCAMCYQPISGDFYGCKRCNFYIDISCTELEETIEHPFHKEHPLTLLADSPYESGAFFCNACSGQWRRAFVYHCSECKFDLDIGCASMILKSTKNYTNHDLEHQTHPHPLIPCHNNSSFHHYYCNACVLPIKGTIYACFTCQFFLHKSCAQLPQEIQHPFHPLHSLTLLTHSRSQIAKDRSHFSCHVCGKPRRHSYHCSKCAFCLDVKCASLMPTINCESTPTIHPHPLIPCNAKGKFDIYCSACGLAFEGTMTIYVCLDCKFFLHKSCAELPPVLMEHPSHPQHPLVLDNKFQNYHSETCRVCKERICGFRYWCEKCEMKAPFISFSIDIACASVRRTLKVASHQHPLAFIKKRGSFPIECSICKRCSYYPFFCCLPCDFNMCVCCVPTIRAFTLPLTFKHSNHRHSLSLTDSPIKDHSDDDEDSEYYCDICEKRRFLKDPTYYCEECHYVAHIHCILFEILPSAASDGPSFAELDEEIVIQAEVDALTSKLETLTVKLDELKGRRAQGVASADTSSSEPHYC